MWRLSLAVMLTGCLHDQLVPCGDLLCPVGALCVERECVLQDAIDACAGVADGEVCTTSHVPSGVCRAGICRGAVCANGYVDAGEVCDDGNAVAGDGCAADCGGVDACPPIGTAPAFSRVIHQPIVAACTNYSESRTTRQAVAQCAVSQQMFVMQGPIDGPLAPIAELTGFYARLAPEGDVLYTGGYATGGVAWFAHMRNDAGLWERTVEVAFPPTSLNYLGTPSRGPLRRVMVVDYNAQTALLEYELAPSGDLRLLDRYSAADLGVAAFNGSMMNMSPDGLRAVFVAYGVGDTPGEMRVFYADRATVAQRFGAAVLLPDVPTSREAYLSEDCGRIYFPGLGSLLYLRQRPPD